MTSSSAIAVLRSRLEDRGRMKRSVRPLLLTPFHERGLVIIFTKQKQILSNQSIELLDK